MSKKIDKEQIAKEICKAAKLYKEHLVGRRFVYVFDSRYIEVLYMLHGTKQLEENILIRLSHYSRRFGDVFVKWNCICQ